jgi:hypothetical protein
LSCRALQLRRRLRRYRQSDRENRARSVGTISGDDRALHGFDKTPADGKAKTGTSAAAVASLYAIEFIEDLLEVVDGNPLALIQDLYLHPRVNLTRLKAKTVATFLAGLPRSVLEEEAAEFAEQ